MRESMTNTVEQDKLDRSQYVDAYSRYASETSPMDAMALAQLAIAALFAGVQIGESKSVNDAILKGGENNGSKTKKA